MHVGFLGRFLRACGSVHLGEREDGEGNLLVEGVGVAAAAVALWQGDQQLLPGGPGKLGGGILLVHRHDRDDSRAGREPEPMQVISDPCEP